MLPLFIRFFLSRKQSHFTLSPSRFHYIKGLVSCTCLQSIHNGRPQPKYTPLYPFKHASQTAVPSIHYAALLLAFPADCQYKPHIWPASSLQLIILLSSRIHSSLFSSYQFTRVLLCAYIRLTGLSSNAYGSTWYEATITYKSAFMPHFFSCHHQMAAL